MRPSGTEPKIKFYVSVKGEVHNKEEYEGKISELQEKINQVKQDMKL